MRSSSFQCFKKWQDCIKNESSDPPLFFKGKFHLIQRGTITLSKSIVTATEGTYTGQNTHFNNTGNKKIISFLKSIKRQCLLNQKKMIWFRSISNRKNILC